MTVGDYLCNILEQYPENGGIMRTILIILKPLFYKDYDIIKDTFNRVSNSIKTKYDQS